MMIQMITSLGNADLRLLKPIPVEVDHTTKRYLAVVPNLGLLLEGEGASREQAIDDLADGLVAQYHVLEGLPITRRQPIHLLMLSRMQEYISR